MNISFFQCVFLVELDSSLLGVKCWNGVVSVLGKQRLVNVTFLSA